MRLLLASLIVLGLSACGSGAPEPGWSIELTKAEKIAGCSPVAHLKSTSKATTNNLEVDISVGGKSHRATFENIRPGQSQTYDMFGLATPGKTCAEFPTTGRITAIPSCLVGGRQVAEEKCLAALIPAATMAQAVPLTK